MISVVMPVHNEAENLPVLHRRLTDAAAQWIDDYEVIVVDDGSSDASATLLEDLHRHDRRWKVLRLSRNFGQQAAISAGLNYASGDAVAIMDADLQDPPEAIAKLIERWREGYDVVFAIRTGRPEGLGKRLAYSVFYRLLLAISEIDVPLDSGDFCVIDRAVVEVLRTCRERTRFIRGLRRWAGFRQMGVPIQRGGRYGGTPKYTFRSLLRLATDGIVSFSSFPLRLATWVGGLLVATGVGAAACGAWCWLRELTVFGMDPALLAAWFGMGAGFLIVSGVQCILLGVVGEYLARVFDEVRQRPQWVVAHAMGFEECGSPTGFHSAFQPKSAAVAKRLG